MSDPRQEELRRRLGELGFDDVRFASLGPALEGGLRPWLAAGMHGEMQWMERTADKRLDPQLVLTGARSVIMLGVSYWEEAEGPKAEGLKTEAPKAESPETRGSGFSLSALQSFSPSPAKPVWARYALHEDYHDTMKPALVAAGKIIEELYGVAETDYRYYVDTGPVLERSLAARAGLGFVGKNAMLISRRHGNWLLLAAILTRLEFEPDPPVKNSLRHEHTERDAGIGLLCGKCTRCMDACPTQAFPQPGVVDARRCVSYQTIENKGAIPRELRPGVGQHVYGCDVCLEVCPWNRFARDGRRTLLVARRELADLPLRDLLALTPERFAEVFRRTPIKRVKLVGLLRNACVVAGNSGDASLLPQLVELARTHGSPLVRAHAVWAVYRLGGGAQLAATRSAETDTTVIVEYQAEDRATE